MSVAASRARPPAEPNLRPPTAGVARRRLGEMVAALRVRNFRLFWGGQLVSASGTWMQSVGQAWLVLNLDHSPFALGTVVTLQFLPVLALALPAGVLADRVRSKRRLLLATQTLALAQALILALLVSSGQIRLWQIYPLALLLGLANALNNPAQQAFVPELVGRELVPDAVALNSVQFNTARLLGPALGGIAIATLGLSTTFYLNAASFLPLLAALLAIRERTLQPHPTPPQGTARSQLREGLTHVHRSPELWAATILLAIVGTLGFNWSVLIPLLARQTLHRGAVGFGLLSSALGAGALAAALCAAYTRRPSEQRQLLTAATLSLALVAIGLSHSYPLSATLLAAGGFAGICFMITANTRLQLLAPDHLRGRIMGLYVLLVGGSTPLGSLLFGAAADRAGAGVATLTFGAVSIAAITMLAARRALRHPANT